MSTRTADAVADARLALIGHPIYEQLNTTDRLRTFMRSHVFAVWDFFSLLKRLQAEVTTLSLPWLPSGQAEHGRFIMEIVLAEEADEDIEGGYVSHFELYHRAMDELGVDAGPIDALTSALVAGVPPLEALRHPLIPEHARGFVTHTLGLVLHGAPHEVAASFCHGRENLLPDVFSAVRAGLRDVLGTAPTFKHYLDRHITLDHDEHGPLALRLLDSLCDGDPRKETEAAAAGAGAIRARTALWDGILASF